MLRRACYLLVFAAVLPFGFLGADQPPTISPAPVARSLADLRWTSNQPLEPRAGEWEPLLIASGSAFRVPAPPANTDARTAAELTEVREALHNLTPRQRALVNKWNTHNPGKHWQTLLDELILRSPMGVVSKLRAYTALHVAMADATLAAWDNQYFYRRPRPQQLDPSLQPAGPVPQNPAYPSDRAAVAGAAERIMTYFLAEDRTRIMELAEEAVTAQVHGGLNLRSDCEAGCRLGRRVAEAVIAQLEQDGRPNRLEFGKPVPWDQPFADETVRAGVKFHRTRMTYSDDVAWTPPQERAGVVFGDLLPWNQTLPVDPSAGEWKPFVLDSAAQFLCPPPPANSSAATARELDEIVTALNNRSCYTDFVVFKWAVEQPGRYPLLALEQLLDQYEWSPPRAARAEAIQCIAMYDALLCTWHEKYRILRPRPVHLEPTLPTAILTPKHPAYPAGHGTYIAAGCAVLEAFFPEDRNVYGRMVEEVDNARVWAGVHYRSDMLAGNALGADAARAVLARVHVDGSPAGKRSRPARSELSNDNGGPIYKR